MLKSVNQIYKPCNFSIHFNNSVVSKAFSFPISFPEMMASKGQSFKHVFMNKYSYIQEHSVWCRFVAYSVFPRL